MKTIKEVSKLTGASVRTLQYYDKIHLLEPSSKTSAGYRLYSDEDIIKLQQILFLKELDFRLKDIRVILNHPHLDQTPIFKHQKELLYAKRRQVDQIIHILEHLEQGVSLDDCAEEIKFISKESKSMRKSLKLFIIFAVLALGVVGIYQVLQDHSPKVESSVPQAVVADVINLNSAYHDDTQLRDLVFLPVELNTLPTGSPMLGKINLPEDLREDVTIQALYSKGIDSSEYTNFISYTIRTYHDNRAVEINFAANREPLRDLYIPEGNLSTITDHEVMIGYNEGQTYVESSNSLAPIDEYVADFSVGNINYNVEARGLNEEEFITLIKSLF